MIRPATVADLPKLEPLAREFYAASAHLKGFEPGRFNELWKSLLSVGSGVIFLLDDSSEIYGGIGGVAYPEQYSNALIAQEFFWMVKGSRRGEGARLYSAFEQWARDKGCNELRMGFLCDLMPEKVQHFYERHGFRRVEVNYAKDLICAG